MRDRYKVGEVEDLLGVTRAAIRYYIEKGLLEVRKDENNGYRYYDRQDILDLLEIIYRRSVLDFSLEDIFECLRAESLTDYRAVCDHQRRVINARIRREQACLAVLDIYDEILQRISENLDRISIIHYPTFYYYPQDYVFDTHSTVFTAGYQSSEFALTEGGPVCRGLCSLVDEKDRALLDEGEVEACERVIPGGEFVYSSFCSACDREDPSLLEPALSWAREQGLALADTGYLCHLFTVKKDGCRLHYYECFLPLLANEAGEK